VFYADVFYRREYNQVKRDDKTVGCGDYIRGVSGCGYRRVSEFFRQQRASEHMAGYRDVLGDFGEGCLDLGKSECPGFISDTDNAVYYCFGVHRG
jgi:hypothetical protein